MRRLLLACAVITLLPACDRSPKPIEPTDAASTASIKVPDSPTLTEKPPTMPAAAKRNDETGAANFVLYWVEVSNYAAVTGNTKLLREISAPSCEGCRRYIELYERTYAAGGYFKAGVNRLGDMEAQEANDGTYVTGNLIAAPGRYRVDRRGAEKESLAEETPVTFLARFDGRGWSMIDLGLSAP